MLRRHCNYDLKCFRFTVLSQSQAPPRIFAQKLPTSSLAPEKAISNTAPWAHIFSSNPLRPFFPGGVGAGIFVDVFASLGRLLECAKGGLVLRRRHSRLGSSPNCLRFGRPLEWT